MKNTFGNNLCITLFGESHGEAIGAVIDGLSPGIAVDTDYISMKMSQRRAYGNISTQRREEDRVEIISGAFNGMTTGTPLTVIIKNEDTKSKDYSQTRFTARPSHADYTAYCRYHGYEDYRGGGHFSGRLTAPVVAAGALILSALKTKGIYIGTHMKRCAGISDRDFRNIAEDVRLLDGRLFSVLDEASGELMKKAIAETAEKGDSVGGILETAITGLPAGIGEPWFDSFESVLSHGIFSIPAVKGIEFGKGFELADMTGSQANDAFETDGKDIYTKTNNNGGINGGITNGMPVIFRTVIKPTPSIFISQSTVDFEKKENTVLQLNGRHDPCILHRAAVVQDAVTAAAVADMLLTRYGTDYLSQERR